jgi:hypothetical protein
VRRRLGTLGASALLFTHVAHAETPCEPDATGCEKAPAEKPEADASADDRAVVNASGLVPLKELNRRPYVGLWFADLRTHEFGLGVSLFSLGLSGSIASPDGMGGSMRASVDGANADFGGISGSYYLPLVGYTPNLSIGLLPELHLMLGGVASGSTSNYTDARAETKVGSALELPVLAMFRIGRHASRYSDWAISLGGGAGVSLVSFNSGQPISDSGSWLSPVFRIEAGYSSFKVGFESSLGAHKAYSSDAAADRVAYRTQTLTLTLTTQPDQED